MRKCSFFINRVKFSEVRDHNLLNFLSSLEQAEHFAAKVCSVKIGRLLFDTDPLQDFPA